MLIVYFIKISTSQAKQLKNPPPRGKCSVPRMQCSDLVAPCCFKIVCFFARFDAGNLVALAIAVAVDLDLDLVAGSNAAAAVAAAAQNI